MTLRPLIGFLLTAFFVAVCGTPPANAARPGCAAPEYRRFDYMIGTWIAHNAKGTFNGKAEVRSVLAGCSVRMHWTGRTYEGTNNNTFDATRGVWQKAWFDNTGGVELSDGRFAGRTLIYVGQDYDRGRPVAMHRESWIPLPDGRVREHYEASSDRGRTWKDVFSTYYRRASRAAYAAARVVQDL